MTTNPPPAQISRRAVLGITGTAAAVLATGAVAGPASAAPVPLPLVPELAPGFPARTAFVPDEQRLASFLAILAPMANDIVDDDDATYGWLSGGWWRTPTDPLNSRIQEHVATFAWFLTHDRPWNPYYQDPALEARLDAALGYYLGLQNPSGAWPVTYEPDSMPATGFGFGALAATLRWLREGSRLPARQAEIETALIDAATWFLDAGTHWDGAVLNHANQLLGGLAGIATTLELVPNPTIASRLAFRIDDYVARAQSPSGYFYENYGPDHGYNFIPTLPDHADLYLLTGHAGLITMANDFAEWNAYVRVREPDGTGAIDFSTIGRRTRKYWHEDTPVLEPEQTSLATELIAHAPALAPYWWSSEALDALRVAWAADTSPIPAQEKPYTEPRKLIHATLGDSYPSQALKDAQDAAQRHVVQSRFNELRTDTVADQNFLFVRRPRYYTGSFTGGRSDLQRSGHGFLWHPRGGMFVQSRSDDDAYAWGLRREDGLATGTVGLASTYFSGAPGTGTPVSAGQVAATTTLGTRSVTPQGTFTIDTSYADTVMTQTVSWFGSLPGVLHVPLVLRPDDEITFDGGSAVPGTATSATTTAVRVVRGDVAFAVRWDGPLAVNLVATPITYFSNASRLLMVLTIPVANGQTVRYSLGA